MTNYQQEERFSFRSFRALKKRMGALDAVVECNELAIREFRSCLDQASNKGEYISNLSSKHSIRVNTVQTNLFDARVRRYYIMSVLQQAEQFFDEFKKEYLLFHASWSEKQKGETDFDNVLRNIFSSKTSGIESIGKEVYDGLDYYRLVRNRLAHSEEMDAKKLDTYFKSAVNNIPFYEKNFQTKNCPNNYDSISFDDFLLCTNLVKSVGYTLCDFCKPSVSEIAEALAKIDQCISGRTVNPVKMLYKFKSKPDRFSAAMKGLLNRYFGKISDEERDQIIVHLERILA